MKRNTGYNRTYKKLAVQWLNEALCFVSSSLPTDSLVLRNPPLRQAANRYGQFKIMKDINFLPLLFILVIGCTSTENRDNATNDKKDSIKTITQKSSEKTESAVDTFFFSNSAHSVVADLNDLDMFKVDGNTLKVCGKSVENLKFKLGDDIKVFLSKNLEGTDTMNFNNIEKIDWSTDLRGDDTKWLLFKSNKLTEAKNWP